MSMKKKQTVLMFPWLGHGHVSPFLELAKKLVSTNRFKIYLCSTPANLESAREMLSNESTLGLRSIQLIDLHLPILLDWPPKRHTTNGLPPHLMPTLKRAFDMASPMFTEILKEIKPNLLIYDMIQYWAPVSAAALGIPSIVFVTTSATMAANMFHLYLNHSKGVEFPFPEIYYRTYEYGHRSEVLESSANGRKDKDRVMGCVGGSTNIVLVKSFKEIEGKYANYLSRMTGKRIVPVGPLVADPNMDVNENNVIQWLDTKTTGSTVFVSFGSEYFLSNVDLQEIAYGLEMSNVNFIWVIRFPEGDANIDLLDVLPLGFLERVHDRGLLVGDWAPQAKILGHKNIGGFVSHCGWSSVMEAMKFGVPIIAMPMHLDQPINARLVAEVGVGVEVLREENGLLRREDVADIVRYVVVSELGEVVRENAKKMCADLRLKGEKEIDEVTHELLELCKSGGRRHGGVVTRNTKKEAFVVDMHRGLKGKA